jgi:hypothetical protein
MPVATCRLRRLARQKGTKPGDDVRLDPGCAVCDQGSAVERWAAEQKIDMKGVAMEKKKKERGKCMNCQREGVVIKCLGYCANCYDTPLRKGYKRGSKEWITCQAGLRARFDPLFLAGTSVMEPPPQPAEEEKEEEGQPPPSETGSVLIMSMLGQAPAKKIALLFGPKDQALHLLLEARAKTNRRFLQDEILSIVEGVINEEEKARERQKNFLEYAKKSQANSRAVIEKRYSINTPEGKTVPAEELSRCDKVWLISVVSALVIGLAAIIIYNIRG